MIPQNIEELTEEAGLDFNITVEPSLTYRMRIESDRLAGKCDGLEAIKQSIYKVLNTDKDDVVIYSPSYGIELKDLFGQDMDYIMSEIRDRITEALMVDDRIEDVTDFDITRDKRVLTARFTVITTEGNLEQEVMKVV